MITCARQGMGRTGSSSFRSRSSCQRRSLQNNDPQPIKDNEQEQRIKHQKTKTMKTTRIQNFLAVVLVGALALGARSSGEIKGHVLIAGKPVAGATVTLYAAGEGAPTQLAQGKTAADGEFELDAKSAPQDSVVYLVAKGPKDGVALMSLLGTSWPEKVTVNELTTVASTFTA